MACYRPHCVQTLLAPRRAALAYLMELNGTDASIVAGFWQATIDASEVKEPSARLV